MKQLLINLIIVLALGMVGLWTAIPAGLFYQLNPLLTGFTAAIGAILGVFIILFLGEPLQAWLSRRHKGIKRGTQHGHIYRVWERYGVVGLGLLAPLIVGVPVGTALGLMLGAPFGRLLFWMIVGIIFWSAILTITGLLAFSRINAILS